MSTIQLSTSDLKKSPSNVRKGHSKEDIHMMANSIKSRGIILPPLVAKNGDGKYEIVAGQLRVAGAIVAGIKKINCIDVTDTPDAERVALSLSENIIRRQMTAIESYSAFDKLFKAGASVEQIASQFSTNERRVHQLLAIGGLPKKILDLAEADEIGDRALEALAIAPKAEARRYAKLKKSERPNDWQVEEWLDGNAGRYPMGAAIFEIPLYTGSIITDLFAKEDEIWCTDGAMFMELQNAAREAKLEEFKKKGWTCKEVDYWQQYAYDRTAKKKGGMVFWCRNERTGAVEFHVGYARKKQAGAAPKAKGSNGKAAPKPETSQAFEMFMGETRHKALQSFMVMNKRAGIEATLALLIKQADNISFRSGGPSLSDAFNDSLHSSDDFIYVHDAYTDMLAELGIKQGNVWDIKLDKLITKLSDYTNAQIGDWIVLTVAHNWETSGSTTTDAIGKALPITQVTNWKADDAFWDGIKNKNTLIKIAKAEKISINSKATTKVIRAIVKGKVSRTWRPSWLLFG